MTKCLDEAEQITISPPNNYVVLAAAQNGTALQYACQRSRIIYGAAYDKDLVETNAVRTAEGLQKLLDDAAERGMRLSCCHSTPNHTKLNVMMNIFHLLNRRFRANPGPSSESPSAPGSATHKTSGPFASKASVLSSN